MVGFYEASAIPTQSCVLLDTEDEARAYPVGDLLLGFCPACGFAQNVRFAPQLVDYSKPTEESQAFSARFQAFARSLAGDLVERYDLRGKSVLEVGCGKGDFMALLADEGIGRGVGIDPGFMPERLDATTGEIEFVRDWYDESHTGRTADLVLTRHLLEHVPNVAEFLGWLVRSTQATPGAWLFTEVPDVARVLREGAFWDVYYEHCSYFTAGSLARTLRGAGLDVEYLALAFDDQYLLAAGRPAPHPTTGPHPEEETVEELASWVDGFTRAAEASRRHWTERIESALEESDGGGRVCLWGGSSKAVAFLTALGFGPEQVTVVDINVHKQGKWLPGAGVEVRSPDTLPAEPPSLVVPMNAAYVDEIRRDLDSMGLHPPIEPV